MDTHQSNGNASPQQSWMSRHPIITTLIVLFIIGWLIELCSDDRDGYDPNAIIATQEANTGKNNTQDANTGQNNTESNTQDANTGKNNTVKIGHWIFWEKHDDFDNKHYRYCQLDASDEISGHLYKTKPRLIVRQTDNKFPEVIIKADTTFRSNILGDERVRLKFDNASPFKVSYGTPSDGSLDTIFLFSTKKILQKFETAKTMTVEFPVVLESGQRASFDLIGYSDTCKFSVKSSPKKK